MRDLGKTHASLFLLLINCFISSKIQWLKFI